MNDKDDKIIEKLGDQLRAGNDELDARVLSRLNQARQTALSYSDRSSLWSSWLTPKYLVPAGTMAAVGLVALNVLQQEAVDDVVPVDDFEVLMAEDSLELYEDLEFFLWLELEQANAG